MQVLIHVCGYEVIHFHWKMAAMHLRPCIWLCSMAHKSWRHAQHGSGRKVAPKSGMNKHGRVLQKSGRRSRSNYRKKVQGWKQWSVRTRRILAWKLMSYKSLPSIYEWKPTPTAPPLPWIMVSRAIVAGGGIGGIPAAIALCKAGFEVKVGIPSV